jgi:hypothetical protein
VFYINGNDYYVASSINFDDASRFAGCIGTGTNSLTGPAITASYNNTVVLAAATCGPGNLSAEVLLPITENGYNDWFVPSLEALQFMNSAGLLDQQQYWSSTEFDRNNMYIFDVVLGTALVWPSVVVGPWTKLIRKETCI